jgi:hypothetical protein
MSTIKLYVPHAKFRIVLDALKQSGVKYYPIRKENSGYKFETDDHYIVSYLMLKYDLTSFVSDALHV